MDFELFLQLQLVETPVYCMSNCAVSSCQSKARRPRTVGVSFHRVPEDLELRDKWFNAIGNWRYSSACEDKRICVCSKHFEAKDFTSRTNKQIKKRALKRGQCLLHLNAMQIWNYLFS